MHEYDPDDYGYIYDSDNSYTFEDGETYEDVYDEDGDEALVRCSQCMTPVKWLDNNYICPNCGTIMERREFFNAIGANPPGPECYKCKSLYPGCVVCPYDYVE